MRTARRGLAVIALVGLSLAVVGVAGGTPVGETAGDETPANGTAGATTGAFGAEFDGPAPTSSAARQVTPPTAEETGAIRVTQAFRLTLERPGSVLVRQTYRFPDRVVGLNATVPSNATVTDRAGFDRAGNGTYVWDGATTTPTLTYRYAVNRSVDAGGPANVTATDAAAEWPGVRGPSGGAAGAATASRVAAPGGADGGYLAVDAGEWALFVRPRAPVDYRYTGDERIEYALRTEAVGPGATSDWLVYLGERRVERRDAHGQTVELVVPDAARLRPDADAVLGALTDASDRLRVGDRDDRVFVVAAPTTVDWGVRGFQTGDADLWVRDAEPLSSPANVWIHEYVHTRQSYRPTRATRWITEAAATYYAALLTEGRGGISFEALRDRLARGERGDYDEVVLADPSTWTGLATYDRGALVVGQLDRRIRTTTDRERTFQTVFERMNARRGPVTQDRFVGLLARVGGAELGAVGRNLTATPGTVDVWSRGEYLAAFGGEPARISYSLPPPDRESAYLINGPYRDGGIGGELPIELVVGEELTVAARASNDGGTAGPYNLSLSVNGTAVSRESGRVGPGETRTVLLGHTFPTPGRFSVGVGGENVTVVVRRPAIARVTNLTLSPVGDGQFRQGGVVRAEARVANDADIPAETTVVFTRNFEGVARRTVTLGPGEVHEVYEVLRLPDSGRVRFGVNGVDSVAVSVEPVPARIDGGSVATATPTPTPAPATATRTPEPTDAVGPGSGPAGVLVGLVVALVVAAIRRRRGRR